MKREIEILLLKLRDGVRILRLNHPASGLCLEKRLDARESVARQKAHWARVFDAVLDQETRPAG